MTECKICNFHYHPARSNCPVCGSFRVAGQNYNYHVDRVIPIVVARNAIRAGQYPKVRVDTRTVD